MEHMVYENGDESDLKYSHHEYCLANDEKTLQICHNSDDGSVYSFIGFIQKLYPIRE